MSLLDQMGAGYHTKEGKRWWPTRRIPWLGFEIDTQDSVVRMEERKVEKGIRVREGIFESRPGATVPARDLLPAVSYLNFLRSAIPGGFCHLRSGWDAVNESGVMELRSTGARRASALATVSEDLRNDVAWRRKMLSTRPVKSLQFGESGGFAWHPRLPSLRQLAMSSGESSVVTVYTDARSLHGWGATLGDHYVEGEWSKLDRREGINWKELWALRRVLETRCTLPAGKLVLVRMDNCLAAAYTNYGAGRVSQLTAFARKTKGREVAAVCAAAALRIAGEGNSVADALSRFSIRVRGLGPYPEQELRRRFRKEAQRHCGPTDVDMLASNDGRNAWAANFRPPANSAFEGSLPNGQLWRFPRIEIAGSALGRIAAPTRAGRRGAHLVLLPQIPWKPRFPRLPQYERALEWNSGAHLFANSSTGHRTWVPTAEESRWAVFRLTKNA